MPEDTKDRLIVGAKVNPDSSLDLSQALYMDKEMRISDPIVDRLRGPLVIDREKEDKYLNFKTEIQKRAEAGELVGWFIKTINSIKQDDQPDLTEADIRSLQFIVDDDGIMVLQHQYGYAFARPYFQMNLAEYRKVYETISGRRGSNGCIITGGGLELDPLTKGIGLTLAASLGPETDHELGHTIDPYFNKRSSQERILEEFGTYYRETYVPRVYTCTSRIPDDLGNLSTPIVTTREIYETPTKIGYTLKQEEYQSNYAGAFKSGDEYNQKVDNIVVILQELEQFMDKRDINKAIFNAQSEYELRHLLEVIKREKGLS